MAERLADIAAGLREVIEELAPRRLVAVEGVFHGQNARSALQLGHSSAAWRWPAAGARDLPVHEYAPATVKRAVAGNGYAATKDQVSAMVRMLLLRRSSGRRASTRRTRLPSPSVTPSAVRPSARWRAPTASRVVPPSEQEGSP